MATVAWAVATAAAMVVTDVAMAVAADMPVTARVATEDTGLLPSSEEFQVGPLFKALSDEGLRMPLALFVVCSNNDIRGLGCHVTSEPL